jgi:hypothetical protein
MREQIKYEDIHPLAGARLVTRLQTESPQLMTRKKSYLGLRSESLCKDISPIRIGGSLLRTAPTACLLLTSRKRSVDTWRVIDLRVAAAVVAGACGASACTNRCGERRGEQGARAHAPMTPLGQLWCTGRCTAVCTLSPRLLSRGARSLRRGDRSLD